MIDADKRFMKKRRPYKCPFKVGDVVRIISKSVGDTHIHECCRDVDCFINKIIGDGSGKGTMNCLVVWNEIEDNSGDYYAPKDLRLIRRP